MSALNLNKVILAGHITHDPELRQTPGGITTTTFNIAVNRRFERDGRREADFLPVVAWRQTAELICRYFKKGAAICVIGSIQTRKWQDRDGNNRYATEIVAETVHFVDGKADGQSEGGADQPVPQFEEIRSDEDLPF